MDTVQHLSNPDLPIIKEDFRGNKYRDGQFFNLDFFQKPSYSNILKWQLRGNPQRKEKKADTFQVPLHSHTDFLSSDEDMIVWLGHASFFIRLAGINMITDPCLRDLPMIRRKVGIPCAIEEIQPLDYILMSHGHRDHFDVPSLKSLIPHNFGVEMLVPLKMGPLIEKLGMKRYTEAGWYQEYNTPDSITITFLPAKHWNRRGLRDYNDMLWGSFLIESHDKRIFFAGDTGYGSHFKDIKSVIEDPIDYCIMPIGAYSPDFMMKHAHANPEEAIAGYHELKGQNFIPMHYGTYDLSDEPIGEPIRRVRTAAETGKLQGSLVELGVGEIHLL